MTMGERIAQKRKEAGLSQEQLGIELGVSRQSIYKWESDTAVPEVEKLVALSKRFSVPVGWLLGAESENAHDAELSEEQLRFAEEFATRYHKQSDGSRKRLYLLLSAVALVLIICVVGLKRQVNTLSSSYGDLQMSMQRMEWGLQQQIDNMSNRVTTTLTEQDSLTKIVDISAMGDLQNNKMILSVMAIPKTCTDSMSVMFSVNNGIETIEVEGIRSAGEQFSAEIPCVLSDDMRVLVTFVDGEVRQTQELAHYVGAYSFTLPGAWLASFEFADDTYVKGVHDVYVQENENPIPGLTCSDVSKVQLGLFCDHKLVRWMTPCDTLSEKTLRKEFPHDSFPTTVEGLYQFVNLQEFPIDTTKTYVLAIVLTDTYGREVVYPSGTFAYTDHGSFYTWDSDGPTGELAEDPADWEY